ncbi:hypothetical protein DEJ50_31460 [Streptomyces venezuelae]|uniref:Secreted protein n=1 Tax=Streptomyces venezuelae TaxID=54571 RepID=A0A5P2DAZ3_STRVZ|nr:peptidase inhibitor family I36 protein [Streptomyces venezuelae]QES51700.1 hypothetical protein DEJ50_31460 [Streptomyces venezuelae]
MFRMKKTLAAATLAVSAVLTATLPAAVAVAADGHLYVWEHTGAGGAGCRWSGDDSDYRYNTGCGDMNDKVSSAKNDGYSGSYEDVLFYENISRRGSFVCLPNGVYWSSMPDGWNDRASSHSWADAC